MYKEYEGKMTAAEMKKLRMTHGVTKLDRIKSKYVRGSLFIEEPIVDKIEDRRINWYCHVFRRPPENPVKRALSLEVPLLRPRVRGRRKHTWLDQMKKQQHRINLNDDVIQDRATCRKTLSINRQNGRSANTTG